MVIRPWENEPDKKDWKCAGFQCCLRRGPMGSWCGYVGITKEHPLHGLEYNKESILLKEMLDRRVDKPIGDNPSFAVVISALSGKIEATPDVVFDIHGGLTYSRDHEPCGEEDDLWWYGFDCSHCNDLIPKMIGFTPLELKRTYRDIKYATKECEKLARQLNSLCFTTNYKE